MDDNMKKDQSQQCGYQAKPAQDAQSMGQQAGKDQQAGAGQSKESMQADGQQKQARDDMPDGYAFIEEEITYM